MGIRVATILAIAIAVAVALSPLALAQSPALSLSVSMKRYDDSVLLDIHLSYVNTSAKMTWQALKMEARARTTVIHNRSLYTTFFVAMDQVLSSSPPFKALNVFHLVVHSRSPNATSYIFTVKGYMHSESSQASGNATIDLSGYTTLRNLKYFINLRGTVTIEKSLIPPDQRKEFVGNLKLMSAMLSPTFVNAMLARNNITWIEVKELKVDVSENSTHITIPFSVSAVLDIESYAKWLKSAKLAVSTPVAPAPTTPRISPEALIELVKEVSKLNVSSVTSAQIDVKIVPGYLVSMRVRGSSNVSGDIEGYYRYMAKYVTSMLLSSVNTSSVAKYLSELVILPYNTSLQLSLSGAKGSGVMVSLDVQDLRIGHAYLTGSKAVDRIATILSSMISGLKIACTELKLPIMIKYSTEGVTFSPSPAMAQDFAKAFERALLSLKPRVTPTVTPPPPPLVTTTTTTATITFTPASSTTTVSPVTILKEVTVSVTSYVTKTVPTTVTSVSRTTITKTITATSTVTKTVTVTTTSVEVKKVQVTNYGLAVGLLILGLAVGGGIAFVAARRK